MTNTMSARAHGAVLAALFAASVSSAEWLEIRTNDRVDVGSITAVEVFKDAAGAERASIWLPSRQDSTTDTPLISKLKAVVASSDWLWVRDAAIAGGTSRQYVRKAAILSILLKDCGASGTCTALLGGTQSSFSGIIADRASAVTDLRALGTSAAFVVTEGDNAGFELYLRLSSIQRLQFTCTGMAGACTAATLDITCGGSRVTHDAKGVEALLKVSK